MTGLRVVAAVVVSLAGGALVAGGMGAIGWLLVLVGWLAALGWVAMAARSRKRLAHAADHWLELGPDGLTMALGAEPTRVPWSEVQAVVADEDRVAVRVERRGAPALVIPLIWRGAGLHDLAATVEAAARGARDGDSLT